MDGIMVDPDRQTLSLRLQSPIELDSDFVAAAYVLPVRSKLKLFESEATVQEFKRMLLDEVSASSCAALLYIFMPDQCHILLFRKDDAAGLLLPIKRFKRKTGYWFSNIKCAGQWTKKPYDQTDALLQQVIHRVHFILNEPVRRGLVDNWRHYRYRGSSIVDFESWLEQNTSSTDFTRPSAPSSIARTAPREEKTLSIASVALP